MKWIGIVVLGALMTAGCTPSFFAMIRLRRKRWRSRRRHRRRPSFCRRASTRRMPVSPRKPCAELDHEAASKREAPAEQK